MGIVDTWSRFMFSMQAGWSAGWDVWTGNVDSYLDITSEEAWDDHASRMQRYAVYDAYYGNTMYKDLNRYAAQLKITNKLYKHIRGVYNPVARYVEVMVGFVYGGALDMETLRGGSVPIVGGDDRLTDAIRQLLMWSNWGVNKALYVRNGERWADATIKVVDDRERQKVYMEVVEPRKIAHVEKDAQGNVKSIIFQYERLDERHKPYTYTEIIDGEMFRTFKNKQPFAFYTDARGNPVTEWENEYGFVPVVIAPRKDLGYTWSAPGFAGSPLDKVNEANDVGSMLIANVRNIVQALIIAKGVKKKEDSETGATKRDEMTMFHIPKDADMSQLHMQLPIGEVMEIIRSILDEIENDLPELALASIRDGGTQMTAPGVRSGFGDAIKRIQDTRSNYDNALVRALQMGVAIGGHGDYENMESYNLDSYARGDLNFNIASRPVIEDTLSKLERTQIIQSMQHEERDFLLMHELDFSDEDIDKYRQADAIKRQMEAEALLRLEAEQRNQQLTDEESVALFEVMRQQRGQ